MMNLNEVRIGAKYLTNKETFTQKDTIRITKRTN